MRSDLFEQRRQPMDQWAADRDSGRRKSCCSASGVGADGAAVGAGALAPGQRWSASRKRDVVLRLLRGESLELIPGLA